MNSGACSFWMTINRRKTHRTDPQLLCTQIHNFFCSVLCSKIGLLPPQLHSVLCYNQRYPGVTILCTIKWFLFPGRDAQDCTVIVLDCYWHQKLKVDPWWRSLVSWVFGKIFIVTKMYLNSYKGKKGGFYWTPFLFEMGSFLLECNSFQCCFILQDRKEKI